MARRGQRGDAADPRFAADLVLNKSEEENKSTAAAIGESRDAINKRIEDVRPRNTLPETKAAMEKLELAWRAYQPDIDRLVTLALAGKDEEFVAHLKGGARTVPLTRRLPK